MEQSLNKAYQELPTKQSESVIENEKKYIETLERDKENLKRQIADAEEAKRKAIEESERIKAEVERKVQEEQLKRQKQRELEQQAQKKAEQEQQKAQEKAKREALRKQQQEAERERRQEFMKEQNAKAEARRQDAITNFDNKYGQGYSRTHDGINYLAQQHNADVDRVNQSVKRNTDGLQQVQSTKRVGGKSSSKDSMKRILNDLKTSESNSKRDISKEEKPKLEQLIIPGY